VDKDRASAEATSGVDPDASADLHPEPPSVDDPRLTTWRSFLYAQSTVMPKLDAELRETSGITLAEFDALLQLGFAPEQQLRMSELADRVLLSRSGVTRLVDRLEREGFVRREASAPDGRGAYAVLAPLGAERLAEALPTHLAAVDAHFLGHLDPEELAAITVALSRVAAANGRPVPPEHKSADAMRRITS
jgi:DNA-binding MarR family transcriptional regulator